MSFLTDLNTTVQYVDRRENCVLMWERISGSWLLFRKFRTDSPSAASHLSTRLLFTKPLGWVEFKARVSATNFGFLHSLQGPHNRHTAAWFPLALAHCPQGDRVGEIMLGLVGPKRLLKNTWRKCFVISNLNHNFISIEGGHKPSPTHYRIKDNSF